MPQPYRRGGRVFIYPETLLAQRPRIGALVAESIAAFARVELALAALFASVLKVEEEAVLDIYFALQAEGPKAATLDVMLRKRLPEDKYVLPPR